MKREVPPPMSDARRLSSRRLYDGRVLALDLDEVEEPGGVRAQREVVRHRGSVAILPVHDDGRLTLVRQYRYAVDESLFELPAGRVDTGETPEQAAARELEEEAGLRPAQLELLSFFYATPGFCDEGLRLFRATALTRVPARPEPDERLTLHELTLDEALRLIASGELRDAKTLVAVLLEDARRRAGA